MLSPVDIATGGRVFPARSGPRRRRLTRSAVIGGIAAIAVAIERQLDQVLEDDLAATMAVMIVVIILLALVAPLFQPPRR
jgi:hypothetical protein